ncbi:Uncharacterised protein [Shigella sonnei]|nr:Uncharacterised protein [Shigella sonnei]
MRFGARRYWVHFGNVDKVNALSDGIVELCVGVGFAVLFTKRHRAKPQRADFQRTVGYTVILHSRFLFIITT